METYKSGITTFEFNPLFTKDSTVTITMGEEMLIVPSVDIMKFLANKILRSLIEVRLEKILDNINLEDILFGVKKIDIKVEDI